MIELWLPYPPSANHLWRSGRGRVYPAPAYVDWQREAGEYVKDQPFETLKGPYKLFITAARPDSRRKRDLGNIEKAISDLLVKLGVVEDDQFMDALHARWVTSGDGVAVRIERAGIE